MMAMAEFTDNVVADDIAVAFYHGGSIAFIHTSPLLTVPRVIEALPVDANDANRPSAHVRALAASAT